MSKKIFHLLSLLLLGNVMVACSSTKAPDMSDASTVMNTDSSAVVSVASEVAVSSEVVVASAPVSDNVNIHNHNSVYYGFNKYDIQDPYKAIVEANAAYIRSNKSAAVQVQGNTDDIGSVEYNLALGQKRADSVKKALIASGVDRNQVESISNGKLKPIYDNTTDAGRATNRRADIIYKSSNPDGYSVDSNNNLPMVDDKFYNGTVVEGVQ